MSSTWNPAKLTGKFAIIREYSEYYPPDIHRAGELVFIGYKDDLCSLYTCHFLDGEMLYYTPDELTVIRDERLSEWIQNQFDQIAINDKL